MNTKFILIVKIAVAIILLQTLYFKFSGAAESVFIFSSLGVEPVGRIGSGVVELLAALLLFVPKFVWLGAGLALGVMSGAILSHLTILGIEIMGDGGTLFGLALAVFFGSTFILWTQRSLIPFIHKYIK